MATGSRKKQNKPTSMNRQLAGVVHISGEHDTGKTTFALECGADPSRILFFDDDVKGRATVDEFKTADVEFGEYVDMVALGGDMTEYDFHIAMIEKIKGIDMDKFDAIIFDTWTRFSSTFHSYILKHPSQFRQNWSPMGRIKGPQQWQEARRYEASIINYMASRAKTVILVTHLKDYYLGNTKVPGKQVPASSNVLTRVPRFRIWLRQNESGSPVPIGLVLKRLDRKMLVEGKGMRTISILPRKIVPRDGEGSLWDSIWRYWDDPIGMRPPEVNEIPNEFELSILDSTLTEDQSRTFKLILETTALEAADTPKIVATLTDEQRDRILELKATSMTGPEIAKELGISIGIVMNVMSAEVEFDAA